jgi:hypothetical protein
MKALSPVILLLAVMRAIYGYDSNTLSMRAVHSDIAERGADRWGNTIDVTLLDGTRIVGRLSKAHNFTGTVTDKAGNVKKYRSYRK